MSKEDKDLFGNRMKQYEERYTSTKLPSHQPIVARIDGKGFSKFTKGFQKPFDVKLADAFVETTKSIMAVTNATCGYAQSDEITLVYDGNENPASEHYFNGKVSKLNSVLASMATAFFNREISSEVDIPAFFDCRYSLYLIGSKHQTLSCGECKTQERTVFPLSRDTPSAMQKCRIFQGQK